ncbi:SIMPL domain-containing protein [Novosphingobium endophyticum]|uniref:SIMPL domain-containing protein n=1 Tax=Novosphingobium endophyticum TaxID=1955250 RepID=A0A916TYA3_9SPHN|nr:SIMPL domain-containing protein [Novosphingobium endophyticum]GGC15111.1 SIMPL domain-containing protein [Novosphingobium endophyticum]
MKRLSLIAAAALAAALSQPALAQHTDIVPSIAAGHTLLTVNAQGSSTRAPDMATFSAGVTTQGQTATEALSANSRKMNQVMAALKRAGIADKDIQTSNLSLNPVYSQPKRLPDGSYDGEARTIVAYEATNNVMVRQRKLGDMGKVIDALVGAGANQVNGPNFMLSEPDAASDEARLEAMKKARSRADLYARAAGLRVVRIVTISESGGYAPMPQMMRMEAMKASDSTPVAPGELEMTTNVTVQFELAP